MQFQVNGDGPVEKSWPMRMVVGKCVAISRILMSLELSDKRKIRCRGVVGTKRNDYRRKGQI